MQAQRLRVLAVTTSLLALAITTNAPPVAAADCALTAPTYVNVGTELTIEGVGFPASTSIDIEFAIEGGASDGFSVQSDPAGGLQIVLVPEDIDIGVTTVQALAGSTCTGQVTYTVLAAGVTPPPATPESTDSLGAGAEAGAPSTHASPDGDAAAMTSGIAIALGMIALGGVGLLLSRSFRPR